MLKNFFAFCVVALSTSSASRFFICAILAITFSTLVGSFLCLFSPNHGASVSSMILSRGISLHIFLCFFERRRIGPKEML